MNQHSCVVLGCSNSATSANRPKSTCKFLNFPIERKDLTKIWLRKLNLEGWTPGPESLICEEHFLPDSFEITRSGRVLKPDATPTVVDELDQIISHYEVLLRNQYKELAPSASETDELRCRLCTSFISLNDAVDVYSNEENVITKILKCIPVQIRMELPDYLPKYICRRCLSELNTSYRMLIRAIESEKFFCHLLANKQEFTNAIIRVGTTDQRTETSAMLVDSTVNERDENMHNQNIPNEEFALIDSCISDPINDTCDNQLEDNRSRSATVEVNHINLNSENETNSLDHQMRDILNISFFNNSASSNACTENEKSSSMCQQSTFQPAHNEKITKSEVCLLFTCQHCCITYETKEAMDKHLETHVISDWCEDSKIKEKRMENAENLFNSCEICSKSFPTQESFVQHSKSVHELKYVGGETVPENKCKECGKKFNSKPSLIIHERVHTGARPYVCENCGSSFRSGANLIQHLLTHSGEKKYKCAVCHKAFVRKASLDVHTRVHTGERPYQCNICKNKYSQVGDLHRHERKCHNAKSERNCARGGSSQCAKKVS